MFWQIAKTVCFILLACCAGCASIPSAPKVRLPEFIKKTGTSSTEEKDHELEPQLEKTTPKRRPLIAGSNQEPSARIHDPETEQLIQQELADATPQEREEWMEFLASIESAMVPYVLNSRRINRMQGRPTTIPQTTQSRDEIVVAEHLRDNSSPAIADNIESNTNENQVELASVEESEPIADHLEGNSTGSRDWSGKLKSLTEWERNPLNFSRHEVQGTEGVLPRQLPKIIANPFQKKEESATAADQRSPATLDFQNENSSQLQAVIPDSLRITPGAKLWEEELHKLVSLMEAEASAAGLASSGELTRDELRQQVALRMLYLVNDQAELAMQPIPGLQADDQEFWISLFWGLSNYLNEKGIDPAERSTKTIEQFRSATHYLQISSKLQLRNASFCSRINGFGSYEQFSVDEFSPGQPVLIYCDIRNFHSEPSDDGFYITKLRSSLEIYKGENQSPLIERNPFPATEDRCRSIRTDYYHSYRIDLPQNLSPGLHLLKLTVYDEFSGKSATEMLKFRIK